MAKQIAGGAARSERQSATVAELSQKRAEFKVHGMDCAEEVALLKAEIAPLSGVDHLAFDVLNGRMIVGYSEPGVGPETILAAVKRTGMTAEPWDDSALGTTAGGGWSRWGRPTLATASALFLAAGFSAHFAIDGWQAAIGFQEGATMPLVARLSYLAAVVTGAWFVAPKAVRALLRLRPDMNLLMMVAVLGAIAIDEWLEAATVSFLFALSLLLESWSVHRARRAVAALMDLTPPSVRVVLPDGSTSDLPPDEVAVGTSFLVKPGERIPLDGRVRDGVSEVNQAPITGESVPVPKSPGDELYAGSINGDGALTIVSTKPARDTMLA
jgi:Cd2+/Zn2+-exporting ATPase